MRLRPVIWIAACVLLLAGALLLWHAHNTRAIAKIAPHPDVVRTVHSTSMAVGPATETTVAANVAENVTSTVKTNPFAYRLSNTSKTLAQLTFDSHAILLQNALIDTASPTNVSIPSHLRASGDAGAYIVQARKVADVNFRNLLQSTGAKVVSYIPNDAYLISADATVANLLRAQPPVQSVIPYEPYYKFQTSLIGLAAENLPLPAGTLLNLGLFSDNVAQATSQIEKLGGKVLAQNTSPFGPVLIVQPPQNWTSLAELSSVGIIEPFRQRVHANDLSRAVNGVAADTVVSSNYMNLTGSNIVVAVDDSGVDTNHFDFWIDGDKGNQNNLRIITKNEADGIDIDGHGTHVAGIIGGNGFESTTVLNAEGSIMPPVDGQFRGMAPLVKILSLSFGNYLENTFNAHDIGRTGDNFLDEYFQETAALTNALISNNSWNYNNDSEYDLAAASYDAATRDSLATITGSQPVLFVFSAGNQGGGNNDGGGGFSDTILSPATGKNVVTVGAVEELRYITNVVKSPTGTNAVWQPETDTSDQVAAFSSRGNVGIGFEGDKGRFKPDVVAPGTFVVSTRSTEWATNAYYNPTNDSVTSISDLLHTNETTSPPLQFFVPPNTVSVTITATTPLAITNNLPIYLWQGTDPHAQSPDYVTNDVITIPPDNTLAPMNAVWQCIVSNTTAGDLPYTLTVNVLTTNDAGDYYLVLSNMNNDLGPWYRYETGTSMSAASVSGVLALMADYFTNTLQLTPSPALLKALLINGARPTGDYSYQVRNNINYEGWGQISLPNSITLGLTTNAADGSMACGEFFVDQSPTNGLATGDTHTYLIDINTTNSDAQFLPLQITLAWTDPPGNPVAAIKLVNNLDLVVSNMDTGDTYFGNDISANSTFNNTWNTNDLAATNAASLQDHINNVEQVLLPPLLDGHYAVTVIGQSVNVNAVYQHTNNIVQDYALVVACGEGEVTNAFTVTDNGIVTATNFQDVTYVTTTNQPLFNQFVGASSPLLGTNQIDLGANQLYNTNGLITLGQTNQWHFYIVTNNSSQVDYTNAAFITFLPDTLALPREGVFANSDANSTRPEADIDLYVTTNSAITNLDPVAIATADKSLGRGGTEFVVYSNSVPLAANASSPSIYYVGVKSEDQMASEFAFMPIFTDIPFGQSNSNGDQYINGLNVPANIPDGSPGHPGVSYVFAIGLQQEEIKRVVVTNVITHQNFGDLVGVLTHSDQRGGNKSVTLNSHDEPTNIAPPGPFTMIYDDSGQMDIPNSRTTVGPGSLNNFVGGEALGVWILTDVDNSQTQTGRVDNLQLFVEKHQDPRKGITVTLQPGEWFYTFIDVPAGFTNLQLFGTNISSVVATPPIQMYLRYNAQPDFTYYDFKEDLTNGTPPGNEISDGPPLIVGRYFIGLFNPSLSAQTVYLLAQLNGNLEDIPFLNYTTNGPALSDDAVNSSTIFVAATNLIASVNVGMVVEHPRISDLSFTLVSPTGQRILLMEDRGGPTTTNAGHLNILTNYFGTTQSGDAQSSTNIIGPVATQGTLYVDYDFFTVPDDMVVYYDGLQIFDSGYTNGSGTFTIPWGPGVSTNIVIVMNSNTPPRGTFWEYTPRVVSFDYNYLTFTEDTNLTQTPIKYAIPPYDLNDNGTNFTLSDFEVTTNGDYIGPTNIFDPLGGWTVPTNILSNTNFFTNEVSVITDPHDAFTGSSTNANTNILALANGYILRTNSLTLTRTYSVSYKYRGPGIVGWWRGEGDATDSSDPERLGQNGDLIGRFNFPAGEVGQAFEFEDAGADFEFAGTNTYVQIRQRPTYDLVATNDVNPPALMQSTPLDVGAGGGMTVEGWINPTNIAHQMPLAEWLARVPTNGSDTNLSIVAGPFLNRDTDHYYYLISPTNWTTSEVWAEQLGGHLATVDSANEENWIYDNFGNYGFTNHNLWIGLTNKFLAPSGPFVFGWADGGTNLVYTNWATGQPKSTGVQRYTVLLGPTNVTPGLWACANNGGQVSSTVSSTNIYGVVEVPDIQTNGVQLWISPTNYIGTTNDILDGLGNLYSNGCIYANLVDTSDSNHIFFSQPLLIQTNAYQYIALTYDTNSGIANLFYNGTNVATTNFGVLRLKTTGDVLLGKDMSREQYNYYGGAMDEMSIYNRALSDAEILAIYNDSAQTTNRTIGKFNPAYSAPDSLAEALVSLGTHTNIIFGNRSWQNGGFTFVAQTNSLVMQLLGLEPGLLLDDFSVSETPIGNLYYLPEQSLDDLKSTSPYGDWTLEVWDNRAGAYVTNGENLISWKLDFILASNPPPVTLEPEEPASITVPANGFAYLYVPVPDWATYGTNILVSASGPVDVFFNPAGLPTANDFAITNNSTGGICSPDPLSAAFAPGGGSNPELPTSPTNYYYLALRNTSPHAVSAVFEVDFDITGLSNGVPFTSALATNQSGQYFSFNVDTNAYEATFQLLQVSNNVDLVVRKGFPLPTLTSDDYGSFNVSNSDENIFVLTNSSPVPLSQGRWYLGAFKRNANSPANFTILAKELTNDLSSAVTIITLTNGLPFNFTAGPGTALTNFFLFAPTNQIVMTTNGLATNLIQAIRFELYHLTGNGDLTVQTNALPLAPPFFESSQNPGTIPELIMVRTNNALTNLAINWYLGVPNRATNLISYTIIAVTETNPVFAAFPGAEGAGAGTIGGRYGDVYHVITNGDDGPGTLRDAVTASNRTVVFDISGTIYLQSPLIITNSFLTIAGQTAPSSGIERFETTSTSVAWANGFEGGSGDYGPSAGQYFAGGWLVDFGNIDVTYTGDTHGGTAYAGTNYIDLNGSNPGGISTNIATIAGIAYTLNFAYVNNPDGASASMGIVVNGDTLAIATASQANSWANFQWQTASYVFTATSSSTHLAFISTNTPGASGMLLDAVSLTTNISANATQTVTGGGITVAGNMTVVTNAHDIVIRDVRFRSGVGGGGSMTNNFEGVTAADYSINQTIANTSWKVMTNQVSLVTDSLNAYNGSNFLALASGVISNTLQTVPGTTYTFKFAYRGPGIAGWWRAENNTNDSINGNNPSSVNNITFASGEVGQAFQYDGSTSLIAVPASSTLPISNLTVEAWVYRTDGSIGRPVFDLGGNGGDSCVQLWVNTTGGSSINPGGLNAIYRNAGGGPEIVDANPVVILNQWNHLAFTISPTILTLYCNGAQVASGTFAPIVPENYAFVDIGYRDVNTSEAFASAGRRFLGNIDEASIYNRVLSASEVQAIYAKGTGGKFDSGVFTISPALSLAEAQVSIAGQTPITVLGSNTLWQVQTIKFTAAQSNTPVQISGIEPGTLLDSISMVAIANPDDALQLSMVSNVVADHISATWSTNNNVSILNSSNVTVQWSVISDSINDTNLLHGYGSLLRYGNGALTFHHNLYADNYSANPLLGDNLDLDFVNNVIYNWGTNASLSLADINEPPTFTNEVNYIGNYLIVGTNFAKVGTSLTNIAFWGTTNATLTNVWIFQTNNFIDSNTNGILDGRDIGWGMFTNKYVKFDRPFPTVLPSMDEAFLAYEKVLDFAGPSMDKRDLADSNIVENVRTQTGRILNSSGTLPTLNSALPYLDTDQDGIPDFWEVTFTSNNIYVPSNNNDRDGDGYTDLEEYNNWLAGPHALTITNTPVGVDLLQLFGNTGNLSFSVTNAVQGFVYLTNVLNYTNVAGAVFAITNTGTFSNSFAIFTPTNNLPFTTNYTGYASFDVYVTNNNTVAYFPVTVSVLVSANPPQINSNIPPTIITLTNGTLLDPTNSGGSDYYKFTIGTNAVGVLFSVTNLTGPGGIDLVAKYGLPLPSLSSYDYISSNNTTVQSIFIGTNSSPRPLTNGDWYLAVINVSGSTVVYDIKATALQTLYPPIFAYPTNNIFTNIETTPFSITCQATDTNSPPLPLTYTIVTNVPATNLLGILDTNVMTIDPSAGVVNWTPDEAQGPTTNSIAVRVSNGTFSVTNFFTVVVEESNLPPVLQHIPDQTIIVPGGTMTVTNYATDADIPTNSIINWWTTDSPGIPDDPGHNPIGLNNGTNHVLTWSPSVIQAGTYLFTDHVVDTNQWAVNSKSLTTTTNYYVTVVQGISSGSGPQTNTVVAGGINWLAVEVPTNAIAATNILLFATNLPVNVWFSTNVPPSVTNSGDFNLMPNVTSGLTVLTTNSAPTNIVPGGVYFLGVQNTNAFDVTYALEVDFQLTTATVPTNALFISSITHTNIGGTNGFLLVWFAPTNELFQVQETADLTPPVAWNTFSNIISFTSLTPTNGIGKFEYFDDGSQYPFGTNRFYRLLLLQVTNTLTLPAQTNYVINVSQPMAVTNTATDSNSGATLTYQLVNFPTPSVAAMIDSNGIISWTPGTNDASGAFKFTTIVTDNGLPPTSATNAFTVFVLPTPSFNGAIATSTNVTLQWSSPSNNLFEVAWTTNLSSPINWTLFSNSVSPEVIISPDGAFTFTDTNLLLTTKFYRLVWLPLP